MGIITEFHCGKGSVLPVCSVIQYATDIEKALSDAATSEERYYQLLCENIYQISKKLEESRKIKMS